jgi:hypothetical protein
MSAAKTPTSTASNSTKLERSCLHLVASALICGGQDGKNLGIRLQIKPGIAARWAKGAKPPALA